MFVYCINPNATPGETLEVPDDTTMLPANLTFSAPPEAPDGLFVVFDRTVRQWLLSDVEPTVSGTLGYGSIVTVLAFRQRFTMTEKTAIEMAALDNPTGTQQERVAAASLRAFLADLASSTLIDLARPDTIGGTQQLSDFNLLAAGRAQEILTSPVQWLELPASIQASLPEPIG
jgi:hypothetical protein